MSQSKAANPNEVKRIMGMINKQKALRMRWLATNVRGVLPFSIILLLVFYNVTDVSAQACPTSYAGLDDTICTDATLYLYGIVTNSSLYYWSTNGGGTFSDPFDENAIYTPGGSDLVNGAIVTLTLTAQPLPSCSDPAATDELVLLMVAQPTVDAGSDASICEGESYTVNDAVANYYSVIGWAINSGTGTLLNSNSLTPTYIPSTGDITTGSAELIFYAYGNSPCGASDSSKMAITITEAPDVFAGADTDICIIDSYTTTDATIAKHSSFIWTGGDGTFSDPLALSTTYTPGIGDKLAGSVNIVLRAFGNGACAGMYTDTLVVTLHPEPFVDAGNDEVVCNLNDLTISSAIGTDYLLAFWTSSGTGTFTDVFTLTPTYSPSVVDMLSGSVTLRLNSVALFPCAGTVVDSMYLTFETEPVVSAGTDKETCGISPILLSEPSASNYSSLHWESSGDGTFNDVSQLNPVYSPSANDLIAGNISLTLSAQSNAPCVDSVYDILLLTLIEEPVAYAGADESVCENSSYLLSDASASNMSLVTWTTSGDGVFDNINITNPIYSPGASDIASGNVTLTITASPITPCTVDSVDQMVLSIIVSPLVNAGNNQQVCKLNTISLTEPIASSYSSILWTTSGTGLFNNATILNPNYTPSPADQSIGSVTLRITIQPISPCSTPVYDSLILSIIDEPIAYAGIDDTICVNQTIILSGQITYSTSSTWTTLGDGTFDDPTSLTAEYTPGTNDQATGNVDLVLSADAILPCTDVDQDTMNLVFDPLPIAYAGIDDTICVNQTIILSGQITFSNSSTWTTLGDGTFDDPTSLTAEYTPGTNDQATGNVDLVLSADAISPCTDVDQDTMNIVFDPLPIAYAGIDDTICVNQTIILSGQITYSTSSTWTTLGDGIFDDPTSLTAEYTPGTNDQATGNVDLVLSADAILPCTDVDQDTMNLVFDPLPIAYAGIDDTICVNQTIILSGQITYSTSSTWTTLGDGTFDDPTSLTAEYTPGTNDQLTGNVDLVLSADAILPCTDVDQDTMNLVFDPLPIAYAGIDDTICVNQTIILSGQITYSTSSTWTTLGDGTFDDPTSLTAEYTPGTNDQLTGNVDLVLSADAILPCTDVDQDTMNLVFDPLPIAYAGIDDTICVNQTIILSGHITFSNSSTWTTLGDGIFDDPTSLTAEYTPGTNDQATGNVDLVLSADAILPCTDVDQDTMNLVFDPLPIAYAGIDDTICVNQTIILSGQITFSTSSTWTTLGDGTFDDPTSLTAEYTPGTNDQATGNVDLVLSADAISPCTDVDQDTMNIVFDPLPIAYAGIDDTICVNQTIILSGQITFSNSSTWTTLGDGIFDDPTSLTAEYTPGTNDQATGNVDLVLSADAILPCTDVDQDTMNLVFDPLPIAYAGIDDTICVNQTIILSGQITYSTSSTWTTLGDGTFDDPTSLTAEYTPGTNDQLTGNVDLVLSADAILPCTDVDQDTMNLVFDPLPIAYAGIDDTICVNQTIILSGQITYSTSSIWTTLGDGTFDDPTSLTAEYTPGTNDQATGNVDLVLSVDAISPCTDVDQDTMNLVFDPLPIAYAGIDDTICVNQIITLSGQITYSTSSTWTTLGDGIFDDPTSLTAEYTPGTNDQATGNVDLVLSADAILPCTDVDQDTMNLVFDPLPIAYAGIDDTICVNQTIILSGQITYSTSSTWTTLGDGTFDDPTSLTAEYTPGINDQATGNVDLVLSADAISPCTDIDQDTMNLVFDPLPIAYAGGNQNTCVNNSINLSGSIYNSNSAYWTTSGDGNFDDSTSLIATYTPGISDKTNGSVNLTLTALPFSPCTDSHNNTMTLNLNPLPQPQILITPNDTVCINSLTIFDGSDNSGLNIVSWGWDYGDGNVSNGQNTIHTYTGTLTDSVMLWAIDQLGCTDTVYRDIWVTDPLIGFTFDISPICFEDTISFIGTGDIVNYAEWLWDFGDGNTGTGRDTSHIYGASGTYSVTLNVCSKSASDDADVIPQAVSNAGSYHSICMNDTFDFSTSTTLPDTISADSVLWFGGTGTFSDPKELRPIYYSGLGELGVIPLSLISYGNLPCSNDTSTMYLTINSLPVGNFTINPTDTSCVNELVTFNGASADNIINWIWDFGDGTFGAGQSTTHVYIIGETYRDIILTFADNNGCISSFVDSIFVDSVFTDFDIIAPEICENDVAVFIGIGENILHSDWVWDYGDGNTAIGKNQTHVYSAPGDYNVMLVVCTDTTIHPIVVNTLPDIDFNVNSGNACVNTSIVFSGVSNSNIISWDWTFGDGYFASGQSVIHSYSTFGYMEVILDVTDISGCTTSMLKTIVVSPSPTADFTYAPIICDSLQFTDMSISVPSYNLVQWSWDFGDGVGISDLQNPTYQYPSNTTPGGEVFMVTLIVMADSLGYICSDSIELPVTVPSLPDIFFTWTQPTCHNDTTYFYGESGFPVNYWHWDFGDGNFSNDEYPYHIYSSTGTYSVTLTIIDTLGCINSLTNLVNVYPVPTVSFSMSDTTACHGTEIQFTSTNSTNVETWYWDFGDGSFSLEDDPIHYFPQGGTYTVTLTVTDSAGCEAEASNQVLILPGATADFTYQNLTCSSVLFNDLSIAPPGYFITNWLWDFGDGFTANVQNPSHSYVTGIGVYDVTLVVTADSSGYSCNDTIVQTIYTPGLPTVFFTWTPEPTMLGNQTDFFGTSGNQITDWYWDFDDGNFATTQDATNTFATVGTFDVELTVTDIDGCQNTILHTVSVTNVPELDYSWNYSCMGEPVQFNVESPPTDIPAVVSWDWDFGDGGISTDMNPLHVYPVAGTYNVSLTIVDTMAATNTIIKQIVVNPLPVALFSIDPLTCAMNDVQFHDLSTTPTGFITQWHWEFGDGNTQTVNFPNDPDVIYQYAAIGTYTVSLTITNSDSCENTTTNDITITASPTAMFSHSEGCESNPFTFTDTSIENGGGIILQWNWDFGDLASGTDNTSTLQNPVHMFSAAGSYDVELMIMNSNGCTDTTTMTITVEEDPEVEFSWTANCQGEETLFEVDETITNVTEVETFAWTFGDGGTSNLQNPTHIYTVAGDYTVTLMITTTAQCMASVTHTVPINPLPTANFDHDAPACLNQEVEFTDLSSSQNGLIETWEWDFGDGNTITITAPDNPDVTHLYTSDGNYDVMLTVTDGEGCINEVTKNVEVVSNPIADFNYDETCYNEPVYFTDMSIENGGPDIQSWEWFFGDPASGTNNNSNLQNPTHVFTAPGVYTTTLIIISTMGCSDTTEQDITIDELPLASIGVLDDSICLGQLAEFTGIGTNISTWYWEFGDGGTSIDQNPSYMYQSPGEYIVTLTVTGIGTEQCTFTTDTTITVNGAPEAMFEYENTCLGDSTYFTDLSYSQYGFVSIWDWDFGDGNTSTMEDPSHYYQNNDDYEVTLIVTDNYGCSDTISLWVQVYDSPNPSFTWDQVCDPVGQVNYFDESTPGTDGAPIVGWSWELDDGYFSSEIDPSYIYNIIDTCYTILLTVTDNNGCESTDTNTQVCLHGELEIDFTTTTVCQNQETTFTAIYGPQSDSVASYTWNFNDGSPIEITYYDTIAHIFPQPGMYIVELTAVDTNDCIATIYKEVTVDSLPTAQFTNTIGNCATATEFTDISLGGGEFIENWYWEFGDIASPDNTSTLQNPTHLYGPNDSIYHVKLIVTNFNGCIDSIEQDVYVEPCVVANFELPVGNNCARTELCFTDTSNITSNNNAIDQWRWEFGDGQTYNYGDHQNPICHTYDDAGDYDVQLIVVATINGTTYQDTMVRTLTVNPTPLAEIGVTNNCLNDTTRFYDNSTTFGAPILTYEWTFGDETTANDTSSMQDPKYKYPSYGDYITQLIVDNEYGCIDTITDTITVFKLPEAEFSFEELCMSYYTYFTDESIGDSSDIANYNWTFDINQHDTNTSIEPSPVNIYDTAGIYYPRLVIMDENLCKDSIDKVVDIKPIPTSNFMIVDTIQQGNIYLQNLTLDAWDFYWDFDYDYGESSTEVSPTHQYEVDGNYDVMLVSYNEFNCPDTMHQIYNLLFTNLFVPNAFSPSSALTDLQIFKPTGINIKSYRLEVYSAWGNLVFESTQLNDGAPAEGWDGTYKNKDLPTGSYIWRISAVFEDGEHWKGTDNGDGNSATSGSVTLIR